MRRTWVVAVRATTAVVTMTAVLTGCGSGGDGTAHGAPSARSATPGPVRRMTVSSPAFADGGTLARRYTCDGADLSPALAFSGVPAGAAGLALLLQDPDAPNGPFTHWLVWDIDPRTTHLSAGQRPPGAAEGRNGFGRTGYGGPCPPHGDRPHHYVLTGYATDRRPLLSPGATPADLARALAGHTLAVGTLTGRYGR
ncbi:YbhB/YbcL family Raf kinase inhibitor-like protein [Streptomyces sp. NPDC006739]|uniref:YbhB/YbcL family Raf kinase inhibitor-like protein n=1 Tax=Streptomyces sp. NPDC006739 TaxID=3364763 RepID=UPI00368B3E27